MWSWASITAVSAKKHKVLLDFFQKIAVSKGRAFGRPAHGAKLPPAAAGEIPNRSKAPSADGAIPAAMPQGRRSHPAVGGTGGLLVRSQRILSAEQWSLSNSPAVALCCARGRNRPNLFVIMPKYSTFPPLCRKNFLDLWFPGAKIRKIKYLKIFNYCQEQTEEFQ